MGKQILMERCLHMLDDQCLRETLGGGGKKLSVLCVFFFFFQKRKENLNFLERLSDKLFMIVFVSYSQLH